jgi:hypothetical protein
MDKRSKNLIAIRSKWDDNKISQLMLGSLPESYRLIVSTISIQCEDSKKLLSPALITKIILNKANHRLILMECANSGSAMYAKQKSNKTKSKKIKFNGECYRCGEKGHKKQDCPKKEEDKSEQKSSNKDKKDKGKKTESIAAVTKDAEEDLFAFTCMSDFAGIAKAQGIAKNNMGAIANSGASWHYCPDKDKFVNYRSTLHSPTDPQGVHGLP